MTEVTNVNNAKGPSRALWFVAGILFSAIGLYAYPPSGVIASNTVGSVVSNAPAVASTVMTTVSGWIDGIGTE